MEILLHLTQMGRMCLNLAYDTLPYCFHDRRIVGWRPAAWICHRYASLLISYQTWRVLLHHAFVILPNNMLKQDGSSRDIAWPPCFWNIYNHRDSYKRMGACRIIPIVAQLLTHEINPLGADPVEWWLHSSSFFKNSTCSTGLIKARLGMTQPIR